MGNFVVDPEIFVVGVNFLVALGEKLCIRLRSLCSSRFLPGDTRINHSRKKGHPNVDAAVRKTVCKKRKKYNMGMMSLLLGYEKTKFFSY